MRHIYADEQRWSTINVIDMTWCDLAGYMVQGVETHHKFRRRGAARALMQQVLEDADRENVPLYLSIIPDPPPAPSYEVLESWYMRCGFVPYIDAQENSYWRPRARPIPDDPAVLARESRRRNAGLPGTRGTTDARAGRPGQASRR